MRRTGRLNGLDDLAAAATLGPDWTPHGSGSKHAETCRRRLLRPPFYGNAPRSGGGMLSALRLQPLLRALRLHLRSAGPVWLSALRATWGLFAGSRLLGRRSTKGKYHHSVSPAEGQNAPAIMTAGVVGMLQTISRNPVHREETHQNRRWLCGPGWLCSSSLLPRSWSQPHLRLPRLGIRITAAGASAG